MCNFLSGIVMRNYDLIMDPMTTDSHEQLIRLYNLRDGICQTNKFARFEFVPSKDKPWDVSTWKGKIDEDVMPDWVDMDKLRAKLERYVGSMIINDARDLIPSGFYILGPKANVNYVENCKIYGMYGGARITSMSNTTINEMKNDSQIKYAEKSHISQMLDRSAIVHLDHLSHVEDMSNNTLIERLSKNSRVNYMNNNSKIIDAYSFSEIYQMRGDSEVERLLNYSFILTAYANTTVREIDESSKIIHDIRNKVVL